LGGNCSGIEVARRVGSLDRSRSVRGNGVVGGDALHR
jgi:hypothetical protein